MVGVGVALLKTSDPHRRSQPHSARKLSAPGRNFPTPSPVPLASSDGYLSGHPDRVMSVPTIHSHHSMINDIFWQYHSTQFDAMGCARSPQSEELQHESAPSSAR